MTNNARVAVMPGVQGPTHLIVWRTTNGVGSLTAQGLCKPKVRDFDVTILIHEKILRLQIAVDDSLAVQVLQSQ